MRQDVLLLLILALIGVYSTRWSARLAPLTSELPLKAGAATALCGLGVVSAWTGSLPTVASGVIIVIGVLFVFGPLGLVGLARANQYALARTAANLLYWTDSGQTAARRLLAQVALQKADADEVLTLLPNDLRDADANVLRAQAYALKQRWSEILSLDLPDEGDNTFLALAAQAQALIRLGRLDEADDLLGTMRERWQAQGEQPLGYRSIQLTRARLEAARGNFNHVREQFQQPLPNTPTYQMVAILAEAADNAGHDDAALKLYQQTYTLVPDALRDRYADILKRYDAPLPEVERRATTLSIATLSLLVVLVVAYGVQLLIDQRYGPNVGSIVAGFLLNIPGVPQPDDTWRYISYAFVHGNLLHIGFNSWVLFDIGRLYERRRHWGNLLMSFVFGTGMGAYLTIVAQGNDQLVLVGASGGVLGIAGALLADTGRSSLPQDRHLTRALLQWIAIIVLFSLAIPNVSLWGHVGGIIGGLLWGLIRQGLPKNRRIDLFAGGVSLGVMVYAVVRAGQWLMTYGPQI